MVRWPQTDLPPALNARLSHLQAQVDAAGPYVDRVATAKAKWSSKNRQLFGQIRSRLSTMCAGAQRCAYCEDSAADEVEHIYPKDLYPERAFVWENYVYACGPCNSPKGAQFSIVDGENLVSVTRARNAPVLPPAVGSIGMIDPRVEDPMSFLAIDLETFWVTAREGLNELSRARSQYTIDVLTLNRDYLLGARAEAFDNYSARLEQYVTYKQRGAADEELGGLVHRLQLAAHPAVWMEMKRSGAQQVGYLASMFNEVPECLAW